MFSGTPASQDGQGLPEGVARLQGESLAVRPWTLGRCRSAGTGALRFEDRGGLSKEQGPAGQVSRGRTSFVPGRWETDVRRDVRAQPRRRCRSRRHRRLAERDRLRPRPGLVVRPASAGREEGSWEPQNWSNFCQILVGKKSANKGCFL